MARFSDIFLIVPLEDRLIEIISLESALKVQLDSHEAGSILSKDYIKICLDAKSLLKKSKKIESLTIKNLIDANTLDWIVNNGKDPSLKTDKESKSILTDCIKLLDRIFADYLLKVLKLEKELLPVIVEIEERGVKIDEASLKRSLEFYREILLQKKKRFEEMVIKKSGRDLFGHSTIDVMSNEDLKRLAHKDGIILQSYNYEYLKRLNNPALILAGEIRELESRIDYIENELVTRINKDGRVYTKIEQNWSNTGRLYTKEPNLQGLPKGWQLRQSIIAEDGKSLIFADYSCFEIVIAAALSNDAVMLNAVSEGDIHSKVAGHLFGKKVTKKEHPELREIAKRINFGILYGMGYQALSKIISSSEHEAKELLNRYKTTYKRLVEFLRENENIALTKGYCNSPIGRRLFLNNDLSESKKRRIARNMPIQSTGADILKLALIDLSKKQDDRSGVILPVHDEIVMEVAEDKVEEYYSILKESMEKSAEILLGISPSIEIKVSKRWAK